MELLSVSNLHILHGTSLDLTGGTFTYVVTCRASTIDYIAISSVLMNPVTKFEVLDFTMSNHCSLGLTLLIKPVQDFAENVTPSIRRLK